LKLLIHSSQRNQRRTQNGSERIAKTVKGGLEKSPQLSKLYEGIAQLGGAAFFDAGMVIVRPEIICE
jgi:hypothetical protein